MKIFIVVTKLEYYDFSNFNRLNKIGPSGPNNWQEDRIDIIFACNFGFFLYYTQTTNTEKLSGSTLGPYVSESS